MSYQALYRVWRPQTFDDLVGQDMITKTLKNALATGQTTHAYLFAGPRGTGKTSCAKLFAKAINCPNQKAGEPCNQCDICQDITLGRLNDVIEIDAASNNGVEEIRDIRDKVKYPPTKASYKVYIIDEVHMLSTSAFNALLKTLEEPPAKVVFILATTDPHKIPATIISRTQRFDFKRITPQAILARMQYILDQKQFKYDSSALKVIAKAAEGGMRDALSILDQVLSFGDNDVTLDNALLVTGSVAQANLSQYVKQVQAGQTVDALKTIHAFIQDGKDAKRLLEDLINYCRDLLLYKQAPQMVEESELGLMDDDFKTLASQSQPDLLYQMIDILNEQQENMRYSSHESVYLEVLTVKLARLKAAKKLPTAADSQTEAEIDGLRQQVDTLTKQVHDLMQHPGNSTKISAPVPKVSPHKKQPDVKLNLKDIEIILNAATKGDRNRLLAEWADILNILPTPTQAMFKLCKPAAAGPEGILLICSNAFICSRILANPDLQQSFTSSLERIYGPVKKVIYAPQEQWNEARDTFAAKWRERKKQNAAAEPAPTDQAEPDHVPAQKAENALVEQAEALFGKNLIEIKED